MARRGARLAAAAVASGVLAAVLSPTATGAAGAAPVPALREEARGRAAVAALGAGIDVAAMRHKMSGDRLAHLLATDPTVWVDRTGSPLVKDPAPTAPVAEAEVARAPFPNAETFRLHSRAASTRTILLDFDGGPVTGTRWNSQNGVTTASQPPFDLDGSPGTWSQAEHDAIQSVWQRVSEDFAPFDVDVTTDDQGLASLSRDSAADTVFGTRVLITPGAQAWQATCQSACGGIAYVGVFDAVGNTGFQPAWVFPNALGNNTKSIAEAASHEAGHNLGLSHDGTSALGYYAGHSNWAPIMGVGYSRPLVQWSRGQYADANNTEDDLAVITRFGLARRGDDHGSTLAAARVLTGPGRTQGVIGSRSDRDVFRVRTTCTGSLRATVAPAPTSPDLDAGLTLLRADGTQVALNNPASGQSSPDVATGLGATISRTVPPGTYAFEVDGTGRGGAVTGYSDYASVGAYSITVSGCLA